MHGDRSADALRIDATLADVDVDREGVSERQRREEHLNADEKVLVARGDRPGRQLHRRAVIPVDGGDELHALQDGEEDALPEREEDDGLDREELPDGVERLQEVLGCDVEEDQGVESERNGNVVNDGDVKVSQASTRKKNSPLKIAPNILHNEY